MARTPSIMVPLGTNAKPFLLKDVVSDRFISLNDVTAPVATVIAFICNHCPFVIHIIDEFVKVANDFSQSGISFVAISSNDIASYPQDGPVEMKKFAETHRFSFPYLYDESQEVAMAYEATCTPDFFVYNSNMLLVYRGQLDDSRPSSNIPVTGTDLRKALDNIIAGIQPDPLQKPSIGCNIKWKIAIN